MSKLGKDGVLTQEALKETVLERYGEYRVVSGLLAMRDGAIAERDAMLELFEEWVAECPCYVRVRLEDRIAALRAGKDSNG